MAKPSKAYLELMQKLEANKQRELQIANESAANIAAENRAFESQYQHILSVQESQNRKIKNGEAYSKYLETVRTNIMESALTTIVGKAIPNVIRANNEAFIQNIVSEFIKEEGVYNILNRMGNKTQILAELADEMEKTYEDETEEASPDDIETFVTKGNPTSELIEKIDGDETVTDIADTIRNKVSRATEDFVEKNVMDKMEIKDTLMDAKNKMDTVRTGDNTLDEEIRQEAATLAKRKINDIRARQHTVYEQLIVNISESVLKNDSIKEQYLSEEGMLNMDKISDKATCIYTMLETLNTLKIKDFTPEDVERYIQFN